MTYRLIPLDEAIVFPATTATLPIDTAEEDRVFLLPRQSGDFGRITLKAGANLQDTCVMHGFPGSDTVVGRHGHIGHGAVLHGCRIGADAMVGMNAVVMDNAHIGERCIVAATAFVKTGFTCPPQSLVMGSPAKVTRALSDDEVGWKRRGSTEYQALARRCLTGLLECVPLAAVERDRPRLHDSGVRPKRPVG